MGPQAPVQTVRLLGPAIWGECGAAYRVLAPRGAETLSDEDAGLLMAAAGAPRREYRRLAQLDGVDGETTELTRLTPPDVE